MKSQALRPPRIICHILGVVEKWRAVASGVWRSLFTVDLRAIAALRIGLGIILLVDLLRRIGQLERWYTDDAITPPGLSDLRLGPSFSIHALSGDPLVQVALFVVAMLAAVALTVGWHTRSMSVISWLMLVSLHHRNPLMLDVGDEILLLTLFWVMLAPAGARWSLDQRRTGAVGPHHRTWSFAAAGLLVQPVCILFFAGLAKLQQPVWRNGSAVQDVLGNTIWSRELSGVLLDASWVLPWLTWSTVAIELLAPLALLVPRLRLPALVVIVGFVASLGLTIQLGLIPWVTVLAFVPFVPERLWDRLEGGLRSTAAVRSEVGVRSTGGAIQALAAASLGLILLTNVGSLERRLDVVPDVAARFALAARLDQHWSMYSLPFDTDYRLVVRLRFEDGSEQLMAVGSHRAGWPQTESWPLLEELWSDTRSRIYVYDSLGWPGWYEEMAALLDWLHRRWEQEPSAMGLAEIEIIREDRALAVDGTPDDAGPVISRQSLAVLDVG